jgi:tetratricopeptide (TPR) repeat protein
MTKKFFIGFIAFFFLLTVFSALPQEAAAQSGKAKKLFNEGEKLFNKKSYEAAINKYAEALVADSKFPEAHYKKGYAHYSLKQYDQSLEELNAALAQSYKKPLEIYHIRWYIHFQKMDYDSALSDLQEAIKLDPKNADYNLNIGEIYLAKKQWQDAMNIYKPASLANPNNADLYYFIARAHSGLGETAEQQTAVSEALKRGTRYVGEAYFLLADAFQKSRKFDDAVQNYQKAINAKPDLYEAYVKLSDLYSSLNQFKNAIDTTNKALEVFKDDGNLYVSLSLYFSLADRSQEAVAAGLKAVSFVPGNSMAHTNLCRAYNDTKQYQLAIDTCNNALKISPADGETNFYLGRAYDFSNKPEIATKYYDKAVSGLLEFTRNNPDNSDGFYLLGNAYYANRQRGNAIAAYRKCLMLSPRFSKARYNLGYIYFLENNLTAAREQYEELRKIDPPTAEKLRLAMEKK